MNRGLDRRERRAAHRFRRAPEILFVLLLALKYAANLVAMPYPVDRFPNGDATGHVNFARSLARELAIPRQTDLGVRVQPPGYAFVIAPLLVFGDSYLAINRSTRALNAIADLALLSILFHLSVGLSDLLAARLGAAVVLGLQPWTSRALTVISPDTITALLLVGGAALIWLAAQRGGSRRLVAAGSALAHCSYFLRAEMILLAPLLVGTQILLCRRRLGGLAHSWLPATLPLAAIVAVTLGFWSYYQGRPALFGRYSFNETGLVRWTETWAGPPAVKNGIVWGWYRGDRRGIAFEDLPPSAFDNVREAAIVRGIYDRMVEGTPLPAADQRALDEIAAARIERSFWRAYVWPRLYNTAGYWIELDRPVQLTGKLFWGLRNLVGRSAALAAYGFLKLGVLAFCLGGALALVRRRHGLRPVEALVAAGLLFALARTAFLAWYLSHVETRLIILAWPFVLLGACLGLAVTAAAAKSRWCRLASAPRLSGRR